jgi:hypothetical protein
LRKGANYSGADFTVALAGGTGTDQSLNAGFTGQTTLLTVTAVPTTSWVRYQGTVTVGSTYTQLGLVITSKGTGTAGANDWAEITGVQLELGSIATTFQRSGGTIQGELSACQRYYWRSTSNEAYSNIALGFVSGTSNAIILVGVPVSMRVTPTSVDFASQQIVDGNLSTFTVSNVTLSSGETINSPVRVNATISGATVGRPCAIRNNNSTSGYIGFSAEL